MTIKEVINKISLELAFQTGHIEDMKLYKEYIQMTLSIGIEHFTKDMEEVVAMTRDGVEIRRYKSVSDAAGKLGLPRENIHHVLSGKYFTSGGYTFILAKDKELIKRTDKSKRSDIEDSTNKTVMDFHKLIKP